MPLATQLSNMADVKSPDFEIVKNKRKNTKSGAWDHFGLKKSKSDGTVDQNVSICNHCDAQVKTTGGGTTNLIHHLRRHHPNVADCKSVTKTLKTTSTTTKNQGTFGPGQVGQQVNIANMFQAKSKYPTHCPKSELLTKKLATWVVKDLMPYRVVDTPNFRQLVHELDPRYKVPSRKQISEVVVPAMYEEEKIKVLRAIRTAEQVALTSDGWTSRATESYVTVTCSFINNWQMENYVLQTRPLPESHTADTISRELKAVVKEWGLPTTHGFPPLVTDNAANMVKAGQLLEPTLHVGCLAHTINLMVQKSLKVKRISHVLSKIRRIVGFFHRSTVAAALLKSKAELLGVPNLKLKMDVCTRWNSAHDMVSRFLELQCAVISTLRCKEISTIKEKDLNSLSDDDITVAEDMVSCLKPLKDMTVLLCSEGMPTLSILMPLRKQLLGSILVSKEGDSPTVVEMKNVMKTDFQSRYIGQEDILNEVSALDPRFKMLPFLNGDQASGVFSRVTADTAKFASITPVQVKTEPGLPREPETAVEPGLPQLPRLPELPGTDDTPVEVKPSISAADTSIEISILSTIENKPQCALQSLLGDVYVTGYEAPTSPFDQAQLQVSQYREEFPVPLSANPLAWWKEREAKYPLLSRLAKCMLCIPATSVPSERVFSTAGDIITQQRASLKAKHVDRIIFLKKNMQ